MNTNGEAVMYTNIPANAEAMQKIYASPWKLVAMSTYERTTLMMEGKRRSSSNVSDRLMLDMPKHAKTCQGKYKQKDKNRRPPKIRHQ